MFTACHPVLSVDARVALALKTVAGLSTEQIARAFLVQTTTMAARITRAKKALTEAGVPFEVPVGDELVSRLSAVLEAVYLIFNEGYAATSGEQWTRAELCQEAIRLGRMLAALAADESEAHALVALMELQASRLRARMADGPAAGLEVTDGLLDVPALRSYHLLPSVRGDLLAKLGRVAEARAEFERAAELTSNQVERAHLLARAGSRG